MVNGFKIDSRRIGFAQPCFVIAEAGVNHNGNIALASELVDVAAEAGADAVKFQTFRADSLAAESAPKAEYQRGSGGADETQHAMLKRLELSPEAHRLLLKKCEQRGLIFLSSPFDESCADFLAELQIPALKIPSGEITNLPYLEHLARLKIPLILSTGMSNLAEVAEAVTLLKNAGDPPLALLHCVSNYPAMPEHCNLRAMETLRSAFGVPVGFSDHTLGCEVSLAAVALGASIIEKHFTSDKNLPGPDHRASLDPKELRTFIQNIRAVEAALGHGRKEPVPSEQETATVARKSFVAAVNIRMGEALSRDVLALRRPGTGIAPKYLRFLVGRISRRDIAAGTVLRWEDVQ